MAPASPTDKRRPSGSVCFPKLPRRGRKKCAPTAGYVWMERPFYILFSNWRMSHGTSVACNMAHVPYRSLGRFLHSSYRSSHLSIAITRNEAWKFSESRRGWRPRHPAWLTKKENQIKKSFAYPKNKSTPVPRIGTGVPHL